MNNTTTPTPPPQVNPAINSFLSGGPGSSISTAALNAKPGDSSFGSVNTAYEYTAPQVQTTLDAGSLGSTVPFNPPPQNPSNTASNSLGASVAPAIPSDDPNRTDAVNQLLGLETSYNKGQDTLDQEGAAGVPAKLATVNSLNTKAMTVGKHYDDMINNLQNSAGQYGTNVSAQVDTLTRQKNSDLADIAIQQKVANDDYTGAADLAAKKVEADSEGAQNKINAMKDYISALDSSPAEKAKMQEAVNAQQSQLDLSKQKAMADYQAKIDAADPLKQSEVAKNYADIEKTKSDLATAGAGAMPDTAVNFWAQAGSSGVNMNSLLPSVGMGTAAVALKTQLLTSIAANAATLGIDGSTFAAMLSDSKAKQKAMTDLQVKGSQTSVNEQSASKYFDTLSGLATKVDNSVFSTGAPIIDQWIKTGTLAATGNPDVNNFTTQMTEALTEYAKVMSGQTTGAGVTQYAAQVAAGLLQKGFNANTINSFIKVAKGNMSDRTDSYNSALKGLFGNIQSIQSSSGGLGTGTDTTSTDTTVMTGPDGQDYNVPNDKVDAFISAGGKEKIMPTFDPTQFGATPVTTSSGSFDPTSFGATPVNTTTTASPTSDNNLGNIGGTPVVGGAIGGFLKNNINPLANFPGAKLGQIIGATGETLYQGAKNVIGGKDFFANNSLSDSDLPTPLQTAGDVAQTALTVAAPELGAGGEATSVLGRIAANSAIGANLGLSNAIANGGSAKDVAIEGTVGGIAGGAGSAVIEGLSSIPAVKNFIVSKVGGLTAEQILSTPESDVPKLAPDEQRLWYKSQAQVLQQQSAKAATTAEQAGDASLATVKQNINDFQQQLGQTNRDTAIALKKPAQQLMKDASSEYVSLTGEAADGSPALKKTITQDALSAAIDSKFEYNPEVGASLKNDLGIKDTVPPTDGSTPPAPKPLTNQQILDKAREIMQGVSNSAKAGTKVYSPEEYMAMQKYSFLMEQLGNNGVDMTKANQFWREWAPIRDRIVREIKPFDETNVQKMPFTSTLQSSEAPVTTARQAATQLDSKNFISELETRMKLPEGTIGADTREALAKVDQAKLQKVNIEDTTQKILDGIKADKAEALKTMSLKQYNTLRTARVNSIIKKTLIGLGIYGAAKATGVDKAILGLGKAAL